MAVKKNQSKTTKPSLDLSDSKKDQKKMEEEEVTLDLPEVKDIPGQEHVRPLPAGEMADTTIASADEEADHLFNEDQDPSLLESGDVSAEEAELLRESAESMG